MNRFFLTLILLVATMAYTSEALACIAGPLPNDINLSSGPTTVCASSPVQSYNVSYSTGIDSDPYLLMLMVDGGTVSNIQGYSAIGGVVTGPGSCVPSLVAGGTGSCSISNIYVVSPTCRGGLTFDVDWGGSCAGSTPKEITVELQWAEDSVIKTFPITYDPGCMTEQEQDEFAEDNRQTSSITDTPSPQNLASPAAADFQIENVSILPNPATTNEVTLNLPATYENYDIQIIDLSGKVIRQMRTSDTTVRLDLSGLDGKMYIVHTTADGFSHVEKLMIAR